ncbi:RNA polymerase sigma factor [Sulfitobacter aestuarii]|uniref:RNA polymerase sigma factor n=1 Tax=Sulfitobacter aestuarii TaxID=2161676 RepID=A0ABW5TZS8_9RHOB
MPHAASLQDLPEPELVARARAQDQAAVRLLIARCNQQLFRVARGILDDDAEAEDVVQAAYVRGFTRLELFRGEAALATWLTRIVMNEAYGRLRRRRRIVQLDDYRAGTLAAEPDSTVYSTQAAPPGPESEVARAQVRVFLERAIDALPEPFRLTYLLRDVQDLPTRDVAELLGVKPVTVKTRLFRARRMLRNELSRHIAAEFSGVFPFDGARCANMADRVIAALGRRAARG